MAHEQSLYLKLMKWTRWRDACQYGAENMFEAVLSASRSQLQSAVFELFHDRRMTRLPKATTHS